MKGLLLLFLTIVCLRSACQASVDTLSVKSYKNDTLVKVCVYKPVVDSCGNKVYKIWHVRRVSSKAIEEKWKK